MFRMYGAAWCEKCGKAKKILQERGLWELVEYVDYETPEGKAAGERLEAENIPFFEIDGEFVPHFGDFLHRLTHHALEQTYVDEGKNE
jgi:glutaredoxin